MHQVIVDGNSIAHWRFWATPLKQVDGRECGMLDSLIEWLTAIERELEPTELVVCFDSRRNWRYEIEPSYKGTRTEKKPELVEQLDRMRDYVDTNGWWTTWQVDGFEADDLCAALATKNATICSRDKDLRQLVDDERNVRCFDPMSRVFYDEAAVFKKHLAPPHRLRDLLAIAGDASDNVRGAPQWGEKTAADAIAETIDFDHLLDRARVLGLSSVTQAKQRTLRQHEQQLRVNFEIVGLRAPTV